MEKRTRVKLSWQNRVRKRARRGEKVLVGKRKESAGREWSERVVKKREGNSLEG